MSATRAIVAALLALAPGCALIDGITGGDEQVITPLECEPYCFVTIIGSGADGDPTAITRRDNPFDFLIGTSVGEVLLVSPQDAEQGGFGRRVSATALPVVDITAGNFETIAQRDFATSFSATPLSAIEDDFDTTVFFGDGANNERLFGDPPPVPDDFGLIVACDVLGGFPGDELVTFHLGTVTAWEVMTGMPAPGGTNNNFTDMVAVAAACGDFDNNSTEDLAILSKDINGDRLIVFPNDGAAGIGTATVEVAPLPMQSGRTTRAATLRYNEQDNVIAVGFACDDCVNQPWSIIREFELAIGPGGPQLSQVGAVDFVAPFETNELTPGDFDGDGRVDYAVAGSPLGPTGSVDPRPNLVILFDDPALLPHPIEILNPMSTPDAISQIEAGPVNGDGRDDIALLISAGPGRHELQYLLTSDSAPMGPPPNP